MRRRQFLTSVAAAAVGAACGKPAKGRGESSPKRRLPRRPYGKTGIELSIVGLGGLVVSAIEPSQSDEIVAWAVERGVNYFDVAPSYGNAQERLGPSLKPYRKNVFLACKTTMRDAKGAQKELEESLRLLKTDHVDLYQLHALGSVEDVDKVTKPGGALELFVRAREKGQARFLGFSAHSVEAALRAMDRFAFDSVLFPLNVVCVENGGFGPQVINAAKKKGVARLALKAMAWRPVKKGEKKAFEKCWYVPASDPGPAKSCLFYTLGLPITAAIPPGDPGLFKLAVEFALRYQPLNEKEREKLIASTGDVEPIFRYPA